MILVVGAMYAGKREFVRLQGYSDDSIGTALQGSEPVLYGLHDIIRENGFFNEAWLEPLLKKELVCCNEVGCGVVPLDAGERKWRDEVGRACCALAAEAEAVVRLVCGIPQIIKGTLPCR